VLTARRAKNRQSECSPHRKLHFVDTASGLWHLQYNLLVLLFRNHRGQPSDVCSLMRWIPETGRHPEKLWDGHKRTVKDFRSCNDFFHTVLGGYILCALADRCRVQKLDRFIEYCSTNPEKVRQEVFELTEYLFDFERLTQQRRSPSEERDRPHENWIMFMQHGLMYRFLETAMCQGDPGRVLVCLKYFTIWLQGSEQTLYAAEMIHLTACLRHCWSEEYKMEYMNNCLVNLSGKKEGFLATDALCEHLIGEIKSMVPNNVTEKTLEYLFNVVSRQIFFLKEVRSKMTSETQAPPQKNHHIAVKNYADLKVVCNELLRARIGHHQNGRRPKETDRVDLHHQGQTALGFGQVIERYQTAMEARRGLPVAECEDILASDEIMIRDSANEENEDIDSWIEAE
jgi:hypothetical protein